MKKDIFLGALIYFILSGSNLVNAASLSEFFNPSNMSASERAINPNKDDEIRYYKRDCANNNALACNTLANLYFSGSGITKDYQKANALYNKACTLGSASSCAALGAIYKNGVGVKKDSNLAKSYYQKACNLGDNYSCKQHN
ncbi:hypothetical protein BKH43_03075 [Helicobacter sp. 13S00401-1]|uniref:tetratricopeptide repeat protein n=1 Tax=Helicobacter sp. 13S00401-1 TaxID=1905758 RepID=UPI000BA6F65C|nr:tetratricopeptide repeat protein [Helicobacter sp. 13S00401-1]PAF51202.1 hypothetical protein BKH43_03075 [Helicobacter sp. 13S00401-1]